MKATEAKLFDFLKGDKQFIIPVYQRPYSWTQTQCEQLWADIERLVADPTVHSHFIGAVVYIQEEIYQASTIAQMLVIDGQQRLTTLMLLLQALSLQLNGHEDQVNDVLLRSYMLNADTPQVRRNNLLHRLVLREDDQATLSALLSSKPLPERPAARLVENFTFFQQKLRTTNLTLDEVYLAINKLMLVDVTLNRQYDNPQLIFESLNSTGLDLSQADLIRNYILMGQPNSIQTDLYENYWHDLEVKFDHASTPELFDRFMRDYLTVLSPSGTIPNIRQVYVEFKRMMRDRDITDLVQEIHRFAQVYIRLAQPMRYERDSTIRQALENLNGLKVDVAYPLLLKVFEDYERGQLLTREDLLTILELVESYVFRRAIVGIPPNSLNKTFVMLKRAIRTDDYVSSLRRAFARMEDYQRFPNDEEFRLVFQTRDVYNLRLRRNYLFSRLENHQRKELVNVEEYTIEHILPQNEQLSEAWQTMLGFDWKAVQERWLHTIGNLTLTRYNPELSDRPFEFKRDHEGGFVHSPLRLNDGLRHLTRWTEAEIQARAAVLADKAVEIWPGHGAETDVETEERAEYRLEDQFPAVAPGGHLHKLFMTLQEMIYSIDPQLWLKVNKRHIAFKRNEFNTFVYVNVRRQHLHLEVYVPFGIFDDPRRMIKGSNSKDEENSRYIILNLRPDTDFEYVYGLLRQGYAYVTSNG